MSDSLRLHGLLSPWNSPSQNTGVGSCPLLQGIFPTQGWNPGLPRSRWLKCPRAEVFQLLIQTWSQGGSISPCSSCVFCFGLAFIFYWSRVDFRWCVCFRYRTWFCYTWTYIYFGGVFSHIDSFNVFNQFSSVQSLSSVWLFATPWTAAGQASLSITSFRSLLKLMSVESVMPSNHLILCCPLRLLPSILPSIRVFSNDSVLHIRWPKYLSSSISISSSNEYPGLISLRMDWLNLLAV